MFLSAFCLFVLGLWRNKVGIDALTGVLGCGILLLLVPLLLISSRAARSGFCGRRRHGRQRLKSGAIFGDRFCLLGMSTGLSR